MTPLRPDTFLSFSTVAHQLLTEMLEAPAVRTERWQGRDVSKDPAATSYELRNACFEVDLGGVEDLDHWRKDIQPNLPWADDHFLERIGGTALNPGEQWKNWPWAGSADRFRARPEAGPRMAPQDWAYLAGMIDGEGTIYFQRAKLPNWQGCVRVYQKNRTVLDHLKDLFRVGEVHYVDGGVKELSGNPYHNESHQWAVGAMLEVRWLLEGCLPYFRVKKEAAESALRAIGASVARNKETGAPLKPVWGREWPGRFQANYMDHFWPRKLEGGSDIQGIQGRYGDLSDLVNLLAHQPYTRQAWFPVFHPDETGGILNGRAMCTLGYQFLVRDGRAHVWYPLRSCDFVRHWRDDCYLAVRLLLWVIDQCRELNPGAWREIYPGTYAMHMTSLHVFENDRREMLK